MSAKKEKRVRALAVHCELGANYPAMHRSGKELESMGLSDRKWRRLNAMVERKAAKMMVIDSRYQDDGSA